MRADASIKVGSPIVVHAARPDVIQYAGGALHYTEDAKRAYDRAMAAFDELAIAEAFMDGDLDIEGDLLAALKLRPVLGDLLWEFFLFTFAFASFTGGFALFAERRFSWHGVPFGPKQVGYIFTYSGLLGIVVQGSLRSGWPVTMSSSARS